MSRVAISKKVSFSKPLAAMTSHIKLITSSPCDVTFTSCKNCHSPLTLAGQPQYGDGSRRTIERIPTNHVIVFCTHWPQSEPCSGRTDDISLNGMKFYSTAPLHLGQIIKIDSQILRAVGKVTRSRAQNRGWEVGVQFVSLFFEQARGSFVTAQA